jgi:hypothetical protein
MSNVTPIRGTPTLPDLPLAFALAIQEQQDRVWRLRSLLETLCTAVMDGHSVDDEEAAIQGLIEYADEALDMGALKERAATIVKDEPGKKQP